MRQYYFPYMKGNKLFQTLTHMFKIPAVYYIYLKNFINIILFILFVPQPCILTKHSFQISLKTSPFNCHLK